jgi:hypothetical protein
MAAPRKPRAAATPSSPHSWDLDSWPEGVWPHDPGRAKWVCRAYRGELIAAGALSRVGYRVIVIGGGYTRWLESRAPAVSAYTSNNPNIGTRRGTEGEAAA